MGEKQQNEIDLNLFLEEIKKHDVISFDIFDTLIFRPFKDPKDLFNLLALNGNDLGFRKYRIDAEKGVRRLKQKYYGNYEVSLFDIYDELSKKIEIDINKRIKDEVDMEMELCYVNPFMKRVYQETLKLGKKIIITSDMYLNKEILAKLLKKNGYCDYTYLYVSCNECKNKRTGTLYQKIKEDYQNETILHIGDKYDVDFLKPQEYNIDSIHYLAPKDRAFPSYQMTKTIFDTYQAITMQYLYNGLQLTSVQKEKDYLYGFFVSGIFVLGYVCWIHDFAQKNNLDKIFFLARDGYILEKVYKILFQDIPCEYVLWSRYASLITVPGKDYNRFIWQFITRKVKQNKNITVEDILNELNILCLEEKLNMVGVFRENKLSNKKIREIFLKTLNAHKELVLESAKTKEEAAKKYYQKKTGEARKIGIVDIGYRASGALSLDYLFKKWNYSCQSTAIIAFGLNNNNSGNDIFTINENIVSYVFSDIVNKELFFDKKKMMLEMSVIEILLSVAPKPSFLYFDLTENGEILEFYEKEDTTNYDRIHFLHQGIIDFVKEYKKRIGSFSLLSHISGYDASMPLYQILKTEEGMKQFAKDFSTYVYSYMLSSGNVKSEVTFHDIYQKELLKNSLPYKLKMKMIHQLKKYPKFYKAIKKIVKGRVCI